MVDSVESSILEALVGLLASPAVKKIGEVLELEDELRVLFALARARIEGEAVVDAELRAQRRMVAYEAEDLLHNLLLVAANFMDSGEQGTDGDYDHSNIEEQ